ncbi:hypothetical protein H8959_017915 [Pygathrix nigripes]
MDGTSPGNRGDHGGDSSSAFAAPSLGGNLRAASCTITPAPGQLRCTLHGGHPALHPAPGRPGGPSPATGQAGLAVPSSPSSHSSEAPVPVAPGPSPGASRRLAVLHPLAFHTRAQTRALAFPRPNTHTCTHFGDARSSRIPRGHPSPRPRVPAARCHSARTALVDALAPPSPGSTRDARRLQFAGTGSRLRPRPHRPWFRASWPGPAPEPHGARRRRRPLALPAASAVGSQGARGGRAAECRAPGCPRLQSGGGGADARAGVVKARGLPAPHCAVGGRPGPGGRGEAAPQPSRARCLQPAVRWVPAPPSECAETAEPGLVLRWGWGVGAGGEELAGSPLLQVIRSPLLRAAKPEAQRHLLAALGIGAGAHRESAQPPSCAPLGSLGSFPCPF